MTDLATKPEETVAPDAPASSDELAWAPAPPVEKPSHRRWWILGGAGAALAGLVAASLVLIAPGTSASGVPVGWLTQGAAADALQGRLDDTTVTIAGETVSARELGLSVDAASAAEVAASQHPMWNPSTWFQSSSAAQIAIDADVANERLAEIVPDLYVPATDAGVVFDAATASYTVTPSADGQTVDLGSLRLAVQRAFDAGTTSVQADAVPAVVAADADTSVANTTAGDLNAMLANVGFYIGTERTVPIDRAVAASWLTVTADDEAGDFAVTADPQLIQAAIDALPAAVNRAAVDATIITNSAGEALSDITPGVTGRALGDTDGLASDFAAQLDAGNGALVVPVTETPFATTNLYRHIEVNLSEQQAYLWQNDALVESWPISSGKSGFDSSTGHFTINYKLASQNMGNRDLTKAPYYFTPDVPYVMYYNGDEALHGAYWHDNFGNVMSHGCINQPVWAAEFAYDWAPIGTEVWVHY